MKLREISVALSTMLLVTGCASVSAPEGGPKDETAPTLLSSNPKDQAINVDSKTITLTFDEEVQQNNLIKELLITPDTQNKYKVKTENNEIRLEFDKPLQENTTYNLNFREGIVDITEKNKALNLKLSFSTGDYIDTSRVSGTVVNLLTQKPEDKTLVLLYPISDTLTVKKHKPYYQGQTDASGNFSLSNIKEGVYNVYALVDKNNNSYYDNENEKIAYLINPIKITPNTEPLKLELLKLDTKRPILLKRENYTDRFIANYNEGIKRVKINSPTDVVKDSIYHKIGTDGKAVEVFKSSSFTGGKTIIMAVDSSGNIAADTIDIKFEGNRNQRLSGAQIKVTNTKAAPIFYAGAPVKLELETPVRIIGKEPVRILADSIQFARLKYPGEVRLDGSSTELNFNLPKTLPRGKKIQVALDSTMIEPLTGPRIKFNSIPLTIEEIGGTGSVQGKVESNATNYIIQLLTEEFEVVTEEKNKRTFNFKNLTPGNYKIRVLVDENKNGKWDAGDPSMEAKPEQVYLHPNPIEVRANWDLEGINLKF